MNNIYRILFFNYYRLEATETCSGTAVIKIRIGIFNLGKVHLKYLKIRFLNSGSLLRSPRSGFIFIQKQSR